MTIIKKFLLLVFIVSLSACSSIHIQENTQQPNKSFNTVNGSVSVGANSTVKHASTVNGSIHIENNVSVKSAETVNGGIYLGQVVQVQETLSTVNGDIEVGSGSTIGNKIETVNGDIALNSTVVESDIVTVSGDITLTGNTHVKGKVFIENKEVSKIRVMGVKITPEITIGPDVVIDGPLIYQSRVELNIDPNAKIKEIVNASTLK